MRTMSALLKSAASWTETMTGSLPSPPLPLLSTWKLNAAYTSSVSTQIIQRLSGDTYLGEAVLVEDIVQAVNHVKDVGAGNINTALFSGVGVNALPLGREAVSGRLQDVRLAAFVDNGVVAIMSRERSLRSGLVR